MSKRLLQLISLSFNWSEVNIHLAKDATRVALEVLLILSVSPKAQLVLCEEIQLLLADQLQMGMRCDILKSASSHLLMNFLSSSIV